MFLANQTNTKVVNPEDSKPLTQTLSIGLYPELLHSPATLTTNLAMTILMFIFLLFYVNTPCSLVQRFRRNLLPVSSGRLLPLKMDEIVPLKR
jgi:hypothetical protein